MSPGPTELWTLKAGKDAHRHQSKSRCMGPAASAIPVQGHPPGTSPRIPLLENWQQVMLGCAADLIYQRGGRGMGGESGTEEAAKGGGESKRVYITLPGQGRCRGQEMVRKVPAEPMSMLPSQGPCC